MNRLPVRLPTATARSDLDRWTRAGQTAWDQRARTLLLAAASGACGPERAQLLGLHLQTTRRWLHAFSTAGLTALAPAPRGGRSRPLDDDLAAGLSALRHEPPDPGR
jgi:transposase